uniref:Dendritic cell-specific transmembrane protein-like domain-containing protein n=1 Tax=Laticauda laticaudata TaxID=8630 RepID=A0A8C5SXC3_LATLA
MAASDVVSHGGSRRRLLGFVVPPQQRLRVPFPPNEQKKRTLLPLRRAEESQIIDPLRLAFQPPETKRVVSASGQLGALLELLGCLPPLVFLLVACALDSLLYTIFSTIRNHSFIQYSFRSSHHLEVQVGGETMMARLLRSTIGALNTSSEMVMETNNLIPQPVYQDEYMKTAIPLGALVMLCFLQVYVFRLRRVIAAFYFPKREKKRIIYLYNEMLRQRMAFVLVQRKRIILRARRRKRVPLLNQIGRWCPFLKRFLVRRCILCNRPESRNSLMCSNPDCETVYCQICWKDLGKICFACNPDDLVSDDESSDGGRGYAD